jgi:hypothetical protein
MIYLTEHLFQMNLTGIITQFAGIITVCWHYYSLLALLQFTGIITQFTGIILNFL